VVYARSLAQLYADLGRAHAARRSAARDVGEWREACRWYEASLGLWKDLDRRGALWFDERGKPAQIAGASAMCERALARAGRDQR